MADEGSSTQTESVTALHGNAQSLSINIGESAAKWLIIMPIVFGIIFTILAFGVGFAVFKSTTAYDTSRDAKQESLMAEYYAIDMETYLYKQGLNPPPDPWRTKHKETKR